MEVVYKVYCLKCKECYFGQARKHNHRDNVKECARMNTALSNHIKDKKHNVEILHKETNYFIRKVLVGIYIMKQGECAMNSRQL